MALDLRANTAVDVLIGPFVDDADGDTPITGSTLDVELSKNGQALANKNDATAPVHDAAGTVDGYYNCELDATDTNTEGSLVLVVHHADSLPVRHEYNVMAEAAWDSMYVAKDDGFMDVNIKTVGRTDTQETEANNLEAAFANTNLYAGIVTNAQGADVATDVAAIAGTDGLALISTDAQDLSGTLDVNTKTLTANAITAAAIAAAAIDNATFAADVGSTAYATNIIALAVRKALDELNLDHLMKVATAAADMTTEIVDNSALSRILASGDTSVFDPTTDSLQDIRDKLTDIETDTAEIGAAGAGLTGLGGMAAGMKAEVQAECDTSLATYDGPTKAEMDTAHALLATPAQVNTEVSDVIKTDTVAEQAQGIPPTTPTIEQAIMYLYMVLRNAVDVDAGFKEFYNNAGTVVWKKALSDDGNNYVEAKGASGP